MKIKNVWERFGRGVAVGLVGLMVLVLFARDHYNRLEIVSSYVKDEWPTNKFEDTEKLQIPLKVAGVKWEEKKITENTSSSTIDVLYPHFIEGNVFNLNLRVGNQIFDKIKEDRKYVQDLLSNPHDTFEIPAVYFSSSYRVSGLVGHILSFEILTVDWTGGGNGNHDYPWDFNWDISKDQQMVLKDIVCKNADRTRLVKEINKQLTYDFVDRGYADLKKSDAETAKWVENFTDLELFQLTDKGVIFVFPPYEVTSGAYGTVRTLIPYERLQGLICLPK